MRTQPAKTEKIKNVLIIFSRMWIFWASVLLLPTYLGDSSLELLVENDFLNVATTVKSQTVYIRYKMDITPAESSTYFDRFKLAQEVYKGLKAFQTENDFKKKFYSLIDPGMNDFKRANIQLQHSFEYLGTETLDINTNCLYDAEILDKNTLNLESSQILDFAQNRLVATWDVSDFNDPAKMGLLEIFITSVNEISQSWRFLTAQTVSELDQLTSNVMPVYLTGNLEALDCISKTNFDKILVRGCKANTTEIYCELLFMYPTQNTKYIAMEKLNYQGVILAGLKKGAIFVKHPETQLISSLICETGSHITTKLPTCYSETDYSACVSSLTQNNNIDQVIKNCNFEFSEENSILPLKSGGLIIQNDLDFKISADNRPVYETLPIIIYSTGEIVIKKLNQEFTFSKNSNKSEIKSSKLTKTQISQIYNSCLQKWFFDNHDWDDYLLWIVAILQVLLVPFCCCTCCLDWCGKKGNKKKTAKKIEKAIRKRNFQENKKLLEMRRINRVPPTIHL